MRNCGKMIPTPAFIMLVKVIRNVVHRSNDYAKRLEVSVTFDPFVYLSLPVEKKTKSVTDALAAFCAEEDLPLAEPGEPERVSPGDRALAASEDESPRRLGAASSTRAVSGPGAESGAAFAAVSPRVGEARVASPTASTDAPMALRRGRAARRAKDSCNNGAESVSLRSWSSWRADA